MHKDHIYKSNEITGSIILATKEDLEDIKTIRDSYLHPHLCPIISINTAEHYQLHLVMDIRIGIKHQKGYDDEETKEKENQKQDKGKINMDENK